MSEDHIIRVLRAQHKAIDALMARLIQLDQTFFPSKSGHIWDAVVAGNQLIQELEANAAMRVPCHHIFSAIETTPDGRKVCGGCRMALDHEITCAACGERFDPLSLAARSKHKSCSFAPETKL